MEFRFRAGERTPRPSSSDSAPARFSHPRVVFVGGGAAQVMRAGPPPPPLPAPSPLLQWEAVAWRERVIRQEVERRLVEQEVRREFDRADLALAGGRAPSSFSAPDCFVLMPMPMRPPPMPMHPHPLGPPPRPFEVYGECLGFGRLGARRQAGLLTADEKRWSPRPPKPKHKLQLREIESWETAHKSYPPSCSEKIVSCEPKVSGMKRKSDTIAAAAAAATEPSKVQKPAQDWACALCQVSATSEAGLKEHLQGKKHKAKLAKSGIIKVTDDDKSRLQATTEDKNGAASSGAPKKICIIVDGATHEVDQRNNYLWCERCRVRCDSNLTMASHLKGKKHSELNKVWTSIMALRTNAKTTDDVASTCQSVVDGDSSIEIPVEGKKEGINTATAGDEHVLSEIPVETKVLDNGPLET